MTSRAEVSRGGGGLPFIPFPELELCESLSEGSFGSIALMLWRGLNVAVKRNDIDATNTTAIDNERELYEILLLNPHDNIAPVFGICTDAPDGLVRIVMKYCEKGSLDDLLRQSVEEVRVPSRAF